MYRAATISALVAAAAAQKVGSETPETHPKMTWQTCTADGTCITVEGEVVLDANWRWLHEENCYDGNVWTDKCSTPEDCATKCAIEGADYEGTYGVTASGDALTLKFVTENDSGANVGSRSLGCGLNGALYFVSDATNEAGAEYGTGYCDAQCPRDLKFINGLGNNEGWNPSDNDQNAGVGNMGSCCSEMDIWEANSISTAYTPHPCTTVGQHMCTGNSCGGTCDPDGCDFNSYRQGNREFYGPGMTVDTNKVMTVVTQFIEEGGQLSAIRRFYVPDGAVIPNSESLIEGNPGKELNHEFCKAQKVAFGDDDVFNDKGGFVQFTEAMAGGMVLVMSLWDDHYANIMWLDSTYPTDASPARPAARARRTRVSRRRSRSRRRTIRSPREEDGGTSTEKFE
ncbi:hypothetical protein VUR80DRAFT_2405 [Thermomyces stellatus]